ncbi:MAG: hypothetical protein AAFP79_13515 [Pseudomonadota bacterium]
MKKSILFATAPMALALTACGGDAASGEEAAAIDADDNDAPEPVADDDHAHPEGTDPNHSH